MGRLGRNVGRIRSVVAQGQGIDDGHAGASSIASRANRGDDARNNPLGGGITRADLGIGDIGARLTTSLIEADGFTSQEVSGFEIDAREIARSVARIANREGGGGPSGPKSHTIHDDVMETCAGRERVRAGVDARSPGLSEHNLAGFHERAKRPDEF